MKTQRLEFKINIKETPKEYIDNLILGLVHSGYNAYLDYEKENICFTGWSDEVIGSEIKEEDDA
jgi:hypothetical protein